MSMEPVPVAEEDLLEDSGSLLPYAFARRHGIVLKPVGESVEVYCRTPLAPRTLAEVRRRFGELPAPQPLDETRFDATLALVYEQQRGAAAEAADNLE